MMLYGLTIGTMTTFLTWWMGVSLIVKETASYSMWNPSVFVFAFPITLALPLVWVLAEFIKFALQGKVEEHQRKAAATVEPTRDPTGRNNRSLAFSSNVTSSAVLE